MMQTLGRRYVRYVNTTYRRTGTLWEGRYRAAPIDGEAYFLACCRYIELNPVRARMVRHPRDYRWSSYRAHALGRRTRWWIMTPLDALGGAFVTEAFEMQGLKVPNLMITTFSLHLRNNLVGSGRFITALPVSVLRINETRHSLKELPIKLSLQPSPVAIVKLRNRTLGPVVQLFVQTAREVAKSLVGYPRLRET